MKRPTADLASHAARLPLMAALLLLLLAACTQDTYQKGQGEYSLMQAELVELHTNEAALIDYLLTDDDRQLLLAPPFSRSWATQPDTLYRALLYYNKVEGTLVAQPVSCGRVVVPPVTPKDSLKNGMKTDPVRIESVWTGKNRRYLNTSIYLMSGESTDAEAVHRIGVVADTLVAWPDGKLTQHLLFYHDQGGVPQYYSQRSYFSIALHQLQADSVALTINTYDGEVCKTFATTPQ